MTRDEAEAEAARRFPHGPVLTVGDWQQDVFRDVFVAGAEWATGRATETHVSEEADRG